MINLRSQKGFTLVELLIVIAIIAVLAMVAVPRFANMRAQSIVDSCRANQGTMEVALEQWVATDVTHDLATISPTNQADLVAHSIIRRAMQCPGETNQTDADDYTWVSANNWIVDCTGLGTAATNPHNRPRP